MAFTNSNDYLTGRKPIPFPAGAEDITVRFPLAMTTGDLALPAQDHGPWLTSMWRTPWEKARKAAGLDSLMAMELRNRLELSLGVRLNVTLIWRYGTAAALGAELAAEPGAALLGLVQPQAQAVEETAQNSARWVSGITLLALALAVVARKLGVAQIVVKVTAAGVEEE